MTEPPRTLEERLRELTCDGYDGPYWTAQKDQAMHEAAAALDAQSKLLAEAREALEPFAIMADQVDEWQKGTDAKVNFEFSADALCDARTVLAKLKAASGEGE